MNDDLAKTKLSWHKRTLSEQMGNIGSEVGRALKWKGVDESREVSAIERALELFDFTMEDKRWQGSRLREICRSREVAADYFYGDNEYKSTPQNLEKYFYYFALAARKKRFYV